MLFNSIHFACFFFVVVFVYFSIPQRYRWGLLLAVSYYFYMCWKLEYIILIVNSTMIDYYAAIQMGKTDDRRKRKKYLFLSLAVNLGMLFGFKYFNFFNDSCRDFFNYFNIVYHAPTFRALLPVGISFYTFQTLSYSIDVYRGRQKPEKHLGIFALYVVFFPQLVAGPIERASRLIPQFRQRHVFDYDRIVDGLRLIVWGLFKKIVVADRLAHYVDIVYGAHHYHTSLSLIVATIFFVFQIYCDFSGYSDIAIGSAKVLGYDLAVNFRRPLFATTIREFWRRWHITLSSWFRDYVYIPLGGNRVPKWRWYGNIFLVFLLSGLWHGANWTFLLFGVLHGVYLIVGDITRPVRSTVVRYCHLEHSLALRIVRSIRTLFLVSIAFVCFRADTVGDAVLILQKMTACNGYVFSPYPFALSFSLLAIVVLLAVEVRQEFFASSFFSMRSQSVIVRYSAYAIIIVLILMVGVHDGKQFIYFQF